MRIGLLADIHGDVANLTRAITKLRQQRAEMFVVLGDAIEDRNNAAETVDLLKGCEAVGVWGNHDLGLCYDVDDDLRSDYPDSVVEFFGTLSSHFECGEYLFSHTLPDQDAHDPCAYYPGPRPEADGGLDAAFLQFPHRAFFIGHFHRWFAADSSGGIPWNGGEPIALRSNHRYFFVINAVMNGWAALLDTRRDILLPVSL